MRRKLHHIILLISLSFLACEEDIGRLDIGSPDGELVLQFELDTIGTPQYQVNFKEEPVIRPSALGFELIDADAIKGNFKVLSATRRTVDKTWQMPWGEQLEVRDNFNELKVALQEKTGLKRKMNLVFRVYDDGLGFRYEFPKQDSMDTMEIAEEHTNFNLTGNHKVWWIPGDWDIYEHLYSTTPFSEINALSKRDHPNLAQTYIPENAVNTPVTMKTESGLYLSFHEAALIDYSGMTLEVNTGGLTMKSALVGSENTTYKVKRSLPFETPWRTLQVAEKATDLIASKLIVNLNEPNVLNDVSWIKPTKYTGIWWEMHLNKSSWDMESGRHGATTENAKAFIDFSAANNIGAVLVEGWNKGWDHWIGFDDREGVFDFITPYEDYDLHGVVKYAKEKGVEIIMHHETSAATETYTKQQDTAFALMQSLGIHAVKTGYVGKILPVGEYHHGQYMVNHYNKTVEKAARFQVAINAHEPIKATGLRRTYPNTISREGLRGQEFNAWASDGGNPPEHLTIVAFTRMLAGPIDYTPGIFDIKFDKYKDKEQVNTTIAQQLALFVVIYSPVQMAADLIENYVDHPGLQFIRDAGVDWQQTVVIDGEVGDFVTIARKERHTDSWFVGGITDEQSRSHKLSLDFLDPGKIYKAVIYEDGIEAHWQDNPTDLHIRKMEVTQNTVVDLKLAPGGGFAISLKIKSNE